MNFQYHELARKEVIETTGYYAHARQELAAEFLAELTSGIEAILATPEAFQQVRPGIRCYLLERFPYGIYYREPVGDVVRILTVRHHSRRPGFGMRRK
jgi:plasmid stabilization system protein ParE